MTYIVLKAPLNSNQPTSTVDKETLKLAGGLPSHCLLTLLVDEEEHLFHKDCATYHQRFCYGTSGGRKQRKRLHQDNREAEVSLLGHLLHGNHC